MNYDTWKATNPQDEFLGYPPDWPRCPACGDYALDGHLTCGRVGCDEGGQRYREDDLPADWPPMADDPQSMTEEET